MYWRLQNEDSKEAEVTSNTALLCEYKKINFRSDVVWAKNNQVDWILHFVQ